MRRVTGIGGIFFRCEDPAATRAWYREHLGIESGEYGGNFVWRHADDPDRRGHTVWAPFQEETEYFGEGAQAFMVNYRVEDLDAVLEELREEGVGVLGGPERFEYGSFAWIRDPDGRRVELWEPKDGPYEQMLEDDATNRSA